MKRAFLAVIVLIALALFSTPATAAQYDGMTMDSSRSYLRLGMNDTIVVTIQLTDHGMPARIANVPVALNFRTGGDYTVFGNQLVITNESGQGIATIMISPDNPPERFRLPLQVMVEGIQTDNDGIRSNMIVYITGTGSVSGYVVDDAMSTITGANISVTTPDGKVFDGGPYASSDGSGSPMGYYRIDNLPVELPGKNTLTAEKNGYTGTLKAEAGFEYIRQDIVIHGFRETVNVSEIVAGNANATVTPAPAPANSTDVPAKPTTMTTTIIIAIALIALVYLGLKAYRRMF
ncbi:MAG: hypothetical protein A4E28_01004 [Methanocella sp. PtaU1.Bin125]|nr:MAG: hypothetical protein A4E28_01004 [Methanocella sp. PtaU1.Bin125]